MSLYARELVAVAPNHHISFEVFSDDIVEMIAQARLITTWGSNVYVKLPVTTTRREALFAAANALSQAGVKVNMTAVFTPKQMGHAVEALWGALPHAFPYLLVGSLMRASTIGRSCAMPLRRRETRRTLRSSGPRRGRFFDVIEADGMKCHIITAPSAILQKLPSLGTKTAEQLSLDAVKTFREDAVSAQLVLSGERQSQNDEIERKP